MDMEMADTIMVSKTINIFQYPYDNMVVLNGNQINDSYICKYWFYPSYCKCFTNKYYVFLNQVRLDKALNSPTGKGQGQEMAPHG